MPRERGCCSDSGWRQEERQDLRGAGSQEKGLQAKCPRMQKTDVSPKGLGMRSGDPLPRL